MCIIFIASQCTNAMLPLVTHSVNADYIHCFIISYWKCQTHPHYTFRYTFTSNYLMVFIDRYVCMNAHTLAHSGWFYLNHILLLADIGVGKVFQFSFFCPPSLGIADLVLISLFAVLNFVLLEYSAIHLRISLCLININESHSTIPLWSYLSFTDGENRNKLRGLHTPQIKGSAWGRTQ